MLLWQEGWADDPVLGGQHGRDHATPGGNVGVGTNNPGVKFHVRGNRIRLEKPGTAQALDLRAGGVLDIESTDVDLYLNNNIRPVRIWNLV
jgi:hypothetical protein